MKRFAACVVAFLFLAPFALAQEPQQAAKEMPAAMLALVVTDSRGNHVRSLSKDDFHISIGGVPVGFETFAERGAGGAPAGDTTDRRALRWVDALAGSAASGC